jgi:[amino group carrier protein]-L-2-aminoadipate 6-kinase
MIVVKVGGAAGINLEAISDDIAHLIQTGVHFVIVHGGSVEANMLSKQLGHTPRFLTAINGVQSRYTDAVALEAVTMAMAGKIKPLFVSLLQQRGVPTVGLTGLDGAQIQARHKAAIKSVIDDRIQIVRDDLTGRIERVDAKLLCLLLENGYIPLLSPPVFNQQLGMLNVDADRLAAAVAVALKADMLIMLSNIPGILHSIADPTSVISTIVASELDQYDAVTTGRMKLKLIAAREALAGDVQKVIIGDGRVLHPISQTLAGRGTTILSDVYSKEVTV